MNLSDFGNRHRAVALAAIQEGPFPLPRHFGIGLHHDSGPPHSAHRTQLIVVVSFWNLRAIHLIVRTAAVTLGRRPLAQR